MTRLRIALALSLVLGLSASRVLAQSTAAPQTIAQLRDEWRKCAIKAFDTMTGAPTAAWRAERTFGACNAEEQALVSHPSAPKAAEIDALRQRIRNELISISDTPFRTGLAMTCVAQDTNDSTKQYRASIKIDKSAVTIVVDDLKIRSVRTKEGAKNNALYLNRGSVIFRDNESMFAYTADFDDGKTFLTMKCTVPTF